MTWNKKIVSLIDRLVYGKYDDNWDNELFRKNILKFIEDDTVLLDAGAGAGILKEMDFKGVAKEVYGVDIDPRVKQNPYLDQSFENTIDSMPFLQDDQFDIVICNNVMEHISNPDKFFREINRILKKDGVFLIKTPNKYHYVPLLASITPEWFHEFYNKLRGRKESDTFPTLYKANTKREQKSLAEKNGFELVAIKLFEGRPEYLRANVIFYIFGILYEKFVNVLNLEIFKVVIISAFKKK